MTILILYSKFGACEFNFIDRKHQLIRVLSGGNQVGEYTFNGAGQRIKKVTQTETRIFHYDSLGRIIAETNQSGQMLTEYIYLGDQLLTIIKPGEAAYYFHNDHLGTPQVLTDATGSVAWKAVYTPFGEAVISISTVENPFRFPGQYYDAETGLHYNYYRYYNPPIGRYLTPDPIGLSGGINLFAYAKNNPVNRVDPKGQKAFWYHFYDGYMVGLLEGKSAWESIKFGINVMMVDLGETGKDPRLHGNAADPREDPTKAIAIAMQLAEENWESGNEALAVHAWGDIGTEGGVYFPGIEDPLKSVWHYIEDAFKPGSFERDIWSNILRKPECVKGKGKPLYLQLLLQILFHPF